MGDGPELFQDERRQDKSQNDQVALILSNHSFEHRKSTHTTAPGLDDSKSTEHKHGEFDLLGFVKLAANDSRKSEFHTTEEKLIVEYERPRRVRVVQQREEMDSPPAAALPQKEAQQEQGRANLPQAAEKESDAAADRRMPAQSRDEDEEDGEIRAVVVGYKKHSIDHVANSKHPEILGGIFNIDTNTVTEKESALVRRGNEERFAEKSTKYESGSVNVGPVPLAYIGDKTATNYYEYKRTQLNPADFVKTNKGFLPIDE